MESGVQVVTNKPCPEIVKCHVCDDNGYLEVTIDNGEEITENQWCQNCVLIEPDYDPPPIQDDEGSNHRG